MILWGMKTHKIELSTNKLETYYSSNPKVLAYVVLTIMFLINSL